MKILALASALCALLCSSIALADTAQVICADEMKADNNTFGGLDLALSKLNAKMKDVKSASAPTFLSVQTPVIVCVTVTK